MTITPPLTGYLCEKGSQDDGAENRIPKNSLENIPLPVNLTGIELIEYLHEDKGVEHDGVMLRGWAVQRDIPATVDVQQLLTCKRDKQTLLSWCKKSLH